MARFRHPELDGVRAAAALLILVYHVGANTGQIDGPGLRAALLNAGQVGVALFFTVSGFLLYRPWARSALRGTPRPAARGFLIRRAVRLLPAYWVLVAVFMLLYGGGRRADPVSWAGLLSLTYLYVPGHGWQGPLGPARLGPIWSLTVEVAWYLALPLTAGGLARAAGNRAGRLLAGIAGYASISFLFTGILFATSTQEKLGILPPRYCVWFAGGMALAVLAEGQVLAGFRRTVVRARTSCLLSAFALYAIAGTALTGPRGFSPDVVWTSELHLLVYGACALCFLAPIVLTESGRGPLAHPAPRFLGEVSYGIFLWQMPVVLAIVPLTGPHFLTAMAVVLPLTIGIAALSRRLVEQPVQAWATRTRRPAVRPVAPSTARPRPTPPPPLP
jgi:peptidoglycan/LPS O-acetylase OafA/YrhL